MRRAGAVVLALLAIGVAAWLLSGRGPAIRVGGEETPETTTPSVSTVDTHPIVTRREALPPTEARTVPAEPSCAVTCVLEDGTPLPGVFFTFEARKGVANHTRTAASGVDGELLLPRGREAIVSHAHADPVAAEGGSLEPRVPGGHFVRADGERMRLVLRVRPGIAFVRLVDVASGTPVVVVDGIRVKWIVPGGSASLHFTQNSAPGGWIPIQEGQLPLGSPEVADLEKAEVEFAMPGFERARLRLPEIRGRMEVRVRPVPASAKGEVVTSRLEHMGEVEVTESGYIDPSVADLVFALESRLRWTGPEPGPDPEEVLGLPQGFGSFTLYDVPEGSWVLEVAMTMPDNTVIRGQKAFTKGAGTVDLGRIDMRLSGKVSLRVVDAAGEAIPQAWAVVVRPEESVEQGRRLDFDDTGNVSVGDLEAGIEHRVVVKGLPREMERSVVAAAEAKPVEFRWPDRLVPCRIVLTVDGKAVADARGRETVPVMVKETPIPPEKGAWGRDGTFEAKLLPGTYRFSALAKPKEGGEPVLFAGETTVPAGESYEVRLALEREGR